MEFCVQFVLYRPMVLCTYGISIPASGISTLFRGSSHIIPSWLNSFWTEKVADSQTIGALSLFPLVLNFKRNVTCKILNILYSASVFWFCVLCIWIYPKSRTEDICIRIWWKSLDWIFCKETEVITMTPPCPSEILLQVSSCAGLIAVSLWSHKGVEHS